MVNKPFHIHKLKDLTPVNETTSASWAVYCAVALEDRNRSPVTLEVHGNDIRHFDLHWEMPQNTRGFSEPRKWVEMGAIALSCFLVVELTDYTIIDESFIGTTVDYCLGYHDDHFARARLEVSGIRIETKGNTLEKREKDKAARSDNPNLPFLQQATESLPDWVKERLGESYIKSSTDLPAYISIVEFNTPKAFFGQKPKLNE